MLRMVNQGIIFEILKSSFTHIMIVMEEKIKQGYGAYSNTVSRLIVMHK